MSHVARIILSSQTVLIPIFFKFVLKLYASIFMNKRIKIEHVEKTICETLDENISKLSAVFFIY